jgi:hypothetical protein
MLLVLLLQPPGDKQQQQQDSGCGSMLSTSNMALPCGARGGVLV